MTQVDQRELVLKQYLALDNEVVKTGTKLKELRKKHRACELQVVDIMTTAKRRRVAFVIQPHEVESLGDPGYLSMNTSKQRAYLGKKNITMSLIRFFTQRFPSQSPEHITKLADEASNHVWSTRATTTSRHIRRCKPRKKRKRSTTTPSPAPETHTGTDADQSEEDDDGDVTVTPTVRAMQRVSMTDRPVQMSTSVR
jgi:hypothetical protein